MKSLSRLLAIATLATGLTAGVVPHAHSAVFASGIVPAFAPLLALGGGIAIANGYNTNRPKLMLWGISVFLLDEKTGEVEFSPIDPKTAAEMGLSEEESDSYNSEVDRLNATLDEVNSDMKNAPKNDLEEIENKSMTKFQEQLSPATVKAAQKIIKASIK